MLLNQIKAKFEAQLQRQGVTAELTFINGSAFSLFCEDAAQFVKAKQILDGVNNATYESEDCDPEIGFFAYYSF